ncbi:MAG: hypothetical protein WDZ77_00960 [Candidatus Pacearchaeota archaeon]
MLNQKELTILGILAIIFAFLIGFPNSVEGFLKLLLIMFLVLGVNTLAKKIASYYLDSEIEIDLWTIKRYGFRPHSHFKNPFPMGITLPFLATLISFGNFTWLASMVFEVKPKVYRAAKRFGLYSFSEMTEYHVGLIAAAGIVANLSFAIIGYLIGFNEFAKLNVFFAFFNIIPLSDLDGNKIFFGSLVLWSFVTALTFIGLGYVFLGV